MGGGESSALGDGAGQDFPRYTIRDMMAAECALVSRGLGLTRLRAVVGRSMGAFIVLEWAAQPSRARQGPRRAILSTGRFANFSRRRSNGQPSRAAPLGGATIARDASVIRFAPISLIRVEAPTIDATLRRI